MPAYTAASNFTHDQPPRTAVLMIQLGTPASPQVAPVRQYLRQFLSDPRVVEIPKAVWFFILNFLVLISRPSHSARKYASVWTAEGSPLMVNTMKQATLLRGYLGEAGHDVDVEFAMRYGSPSVAEVMRKLRERNLTRLLVLPMYPQYSATTTASSFDEVFRELAQWRNLPELRFARSYHAFDPYIEALAQRVRSAWEIDGPPEKLLMSFHGLPRRNLDLGDPYHCECLVTGRLLAGRLGLREQDYVISFQSRFGAAKWLQPYTDATLTALGKQGVRRVDVVCPGFVADCLETLEEIAIEGKQSFTKAGGTDFRYIPCLNDSPAAIRALQALVIEQMQGWPTLRNTDPQAIEAARASLARTQERARAAGANR